MEEYQSNPLGGGWFETWTMHPGVGLITAIGVSLQSAWCRLAETYRDATRNPHHFIGCNFPCRCSEPHGKA